MKRRRRHPAVSTVSTVRNRMPEPEPRTLAIYDGTEFQGFLIVRGAYHYEAFARNGKSLGLFPTQAEASRAVPRRAKERP
jgi:hypothetical protein